MSARPASTSLTRRRNEKSASQTRLSVDVVAVVVVGVAVGLVVVDRNVRGMRLLLWYLSTRVESPPSRHFGKFRRRK